jgi:hypothetical protein
MAAIIRKYPPISVVDSIISFKNEDGGRSVHSAHGQTNVFSDDEILKIHSFIRTESIGNRVMAGFSEHGKAIIQQQGCRGCTAATTAMIIMDAGGKPDVFRLKRCNLGDEHTIRDDILRAGKKPRFLIEKNLQDLRIQLLEGGSAIVSIHDSEVGGHSIVVDDVSSDLKEVRLRDPYHGWEITIKAAAFIMKWSIQHSIIQIQ